jgi:hypothetical protein
MLGLGLGAALIEACATSPEAFRKVADTATAQPSDPKTDGSWSPMVQLKDLTYTFPGTHERPRPDDGWWFSPIHVNLLSSGKVLISGWGRPKEEFCIDKMGRENGETFLLDIRDLENNSTGQMNISPIWEEPLLDGDVLYCSGHVPLGNGKVLFSGGAKYKNLDIQGIGIAVAPPPGNEQDEFGLNYERIFDEDSRKFTRLSATSPAGPNPSPSDRASPNWSWYEQGQMWYPTNTRIPGGKVLVAGGFAKWAGPLDPNQFYNRSLAIFDPSKLPSGQNPWSVLVKHEVAPTALNLADFDYIHSLLLEAPVPASTTQASHHPRQMVLFGGVTGNLSLLSLDDSIPENERLTIPPNSARPAKGANWHVLATDTTTALTSTGEILIMGGGDHGLNEGSRIDLYDPMKDSWRSFDTGITRIRAASTLLPDGTVLILNGEAMWSPNPSQGDRRQPTIFDPAAGTVTNLKAWPDDANDRGYHNFSLLLKDGRILVGGGRTLVTNAQGLEQNRIGCERTDIRIFSPPYLFKGPRPVISKLLTSPELVISNPAKKLVLSYSGPALKKSGGAVLMALGAETHHFDQNQRYVPVTFTQKNGGTVEISPPSSSLAAPEGDYILYLVSDQGVPSIGQSVVVK